MGLNTGNTLVSPAKKTSSEAVSNARLNNPFWEGSFEHILPSQETITNVGNTVLQESGTALDAVASLIKENVLFKTENPEPGENNKPFPSKGSIENFQDRIEPPTPNLLQMPHHRPDYVELHGIKERKVITQAEFRKIVKLQVGFDVTADEYHKSEAERTLKEQEKEAEAAATKQKTLAMATHGKSKGGVDLRQASVSEKTAGGHVLSTAG